VPNLNREMKLMKNILILVGILVCAGIPYLTLVIWHVTQKRPPAEPTYLLAMIAISVFFAIKMIILFYMNKEVKNVAVEYIKKLTPF
jgi:glucan phosphoethanolaminetransferase (alkaline phosphatase superfamily)